MARPPSSTKPSASPRNCSLAAHRGTGRPPDRPTCNGSMSTRCVCSVPAASGLSNSACGRWSARRVAPAAAAVGRLGCKRASCSASRDRRRVRDALVKHRGASVRMGLFDRQPTVLRPDQHLLAGAARALEGERSDCPPGPDARRQAVPRSSPATSANSARWRRHPAPARGTPVMRPRGKARSAGCDRMQWGFHHGLLREREPQGIAGFQIEQIDRVMRDGAHLVAPRHVVACADQKYAPARRARRRPAPRGRPQNAHLTDPSHRFAHVCSATRAFLSA